MSKNTNQSKETDQQPLSSASECSNRYSNPSNIGEVTCMYLGSMLFDRYHLFFRHFLAPDVPQPIREACESCEEEENVISRVRVGFRIKHHWMHICSVSW